MMSGVHFPLIKSGSGGAYSTCSSKHHPVGPSARAVHQIASVESLPYPTPKTQAWAMYQSDRPGRSELDIGRTDTCISLRDTTGNFSAFRFVTRHWTPLLILNMCDMIESYGSGLSDVIISLAAIIVHIATAKMSTPTT
jgi:hypothetical protein